MNSTGRVKSQEELDFLQNIRKRLGREGNPEHVAPYQRGVPDFYREIRMTKEEKIESFIRNLESVNGYGHVVRGREGLRDKLAEILAKYDFKRAVRWNHPFLNDLGVDEVLAKAGISVKLWDPSRSREDNVEAARQADLGITTADYAIANTGTVALFAGGEQGRSVSLLPPAYIVVFKPDRLVTRMGEMLEACKVALPSSVNFITGPSRSADIEMNLTLGVHGPKYVHAVIVDD